MAKIRIGWIGYVEGKPYWEDCVDDFSGVDDDFKTVNLFKNKKDAKKRFEDVREVFVEK